MAYYAALVSAVQLLKEISFSHHGYPDYLFDKQQITSLCEKLSRLQDLLQDYSPKDDEEAADLLERRIRDAAYQAQDLIESHISDQNPPRNRKYKVLTRRRKIDMLRRLHQQLEKVKFEVDSIVEELVRIKKRCRAHEEDHWQLDAVLVRLLEEISSHDQSHDSLLDKRQMASLIEKFKLLKELLGEGELAEFMERRIRRAAYRARDIIETHVSDRKCGILTLSIMAREYQDLERLKREVGSIVEEMMRTKMEGLAIREGNSEVFPNSADSTEASIQAESSGVASKVQAPSGRNIIVGFDGHLTTIKDQLSGRSSRLEVIPIVGMGGIGKTTLARNIFDDKFIDDYFDCRAWVTVTQDYHLQNVLRAILTSLNRKQDLHEAGEDLLKEYIYKHLKGRRYLIIMDDIWDTKIWDSIKRILPDDSNGSRVILTSRLLDVAIYAGSLEFLLHMQFLTEDQSWSLFCEKVFCPHELEDVGRLIAKKCRGLPLAIVVVAGLLSKANTTRHDWEEIVRSISSTVAESDEHFSKILFLSYNHLPHHLKPCFLYFGGFPEEISTSKLIKLWVAEGFLKPIEYKTFEEVAEEYLEELVHRNLVLATKWKSNGKFRCCSIHDLLRDLCFKRARDENFLHIRHKNADYSHQEATGNIRRLYIHQDYTFPEFPSKKDVSHVRSILFFPDTWDQFSSDATDFKLLRVLDAPNLMFDLFPDQLLELMHLRYLALLRRNFGIPSLIFKLQNLQTLTVSSAPSLYCLPVLLPPEIWKMPHLRHIMIDEVQLPKIPPGSNIHGAPLLEKLQTLWNVVNLTLTRRTVDMIPNVKKLKLVYNERRKRKWLWFGLYNLVHLRKLEALDIKFSPYGSYKYVEVPEFFAFPLTLKRLSLKGCMLPWKDMMVVGSLPNLRVLKLRWASFAGDEWQPTEGQFPKLTYLLMEELSDLKYWRAENMHFPCLEQLHINDCKALEQIPLELGDIPTLQLIEVFNCDSSLESSALKLLDEQRELGNDILEVHTYHWDSTSSMHSESSEDEELEETSSK